MSTSAFITVSREATASEIKSLATLSSHPISLDCSLCLFQGINGIQPMNQTLGKECSFLFWICSNVFIDSLRDP